MTPLVLSASALLALQLSSARAQSPAVDREVQQVQSAVLRGDVSTSRAAVDRAVQGKSAVERAEIQIAAADVLARADDQASKAEAERLYVASLDSARQTFSPDRRLRAENNYAALLMRLGRSAEARKQLETMREPMRKQPPAAQARYLFNYGKSLEQSGNAAQALRIYDEALALAPEFEDPARAASALALTSPSESIGIPATVTIVDRMLAARQFAVAQQHLLKAIAQPRWIAHPQYPLILASTARYFVAADVDRAGFEREWQQPLAAAVQNASPRAKARYDDLQRAYTPKGIDLVYEQQVARSRFAAWGGSDAEIASFVSLLHEVGRQARAAGNTSDALNRMASAWAFSRIGGPGSDDAGMAAAVDLADLLLSAGPELTASQQILQEIIAQLFEGKGRAYAGRDYASALRFHLLLGTIFERQKRWGPASNPYSALFQWQAALKDHELLRAGGRPGNLAEVPGLHLRLGQAFEAVGDRAGALRSYMNASEAFMNLKSPVPASDALARARPLASFGTAADQRRLQEMEKVVPRRPS
jgi:tetratricopeptide (TPR) repeat protein